jgi:uncharacterized membrane protein HdeD (DUF308 family)
MKDKIFKPKQEFDSIVKPILLLIIGIIMFLNPKGIITISLYSIAAIMFVVGLFKIIMHYIAPIDKKILLTGLINLLVGLIIAVFTFFAYDTVQIIFRYSFAALLIFTAVMRIVKAFSLPKNLKLVYLITSSILILIAIVLMVFDLAITTTGLFISLYSIVDIAGYIFNNKYLEENSKIPEATVLKEKEEKPKEIESTTE